jgi:hypothetical protein
VPRSINIEGYTPDEVLAFADEQLDAFVFTGSPIVFGIGTAEVLGQFEVRDDRLIIDLAHIDGGGEGLLPTIGMLVSRIAERRSLRGVEWLVHAVNCAQPNQKLRRMLERRGFEVVNDAQLGEVYRLAETISRGPSGR